MLMGGGFVVNVIVFAVVVVGVVVVAVDAGEDAPQTQQPVIYSDLEGHFHLRTAANGSWFVNDLDIGSMLSQTKATLQTQLSLGADLLAMVSALAVKGEEQQIAIDALEESVNQIPCSVLNPLPFASADYNYDVDVLGQGLRVDFASSYLRVGSFGTRKWQSTVLASNGMIYGAPHSTNSILVIDPEENESFTIPVSYSGTYGWCQSVEADNGKLYFVPIFADNVLIVDPNNNNAVDQASITGLDSGAAKWYSGAKAPNNGNIYCVPYNLDSVLIIDPSDDTADTTTISGLPAVGSKWVGAVLANNGLIYGIPYSYGFVLVINPMTNTADYTSVPVESGSFKWLDGVLANNGKIYGMPSNVAKVLVVDTANNNAVSYIDVTPPASFANWYGGVLTGNGKIVGTPSIANAILVIDPETDTADTVPINGPGGSTSKWSGAVFLPTHNRIFSIPEQHDYILQLDLDPCM